MLTTQTRPLYVIAAEIRADWTKPYFGAVPYIEALATVSRLDDRFFSEDGRTQVLYFLSNAGTWRGETARRVKAELRAMLEG